MTDMDLQSRVNAVEGKLERHGVLLETMARDFELLRHGMATREVVDAAIAALAAQVAASEDYLSTAIENQGTALNLKLKHLQDKVDPISRGISRLAWLIITAILGVVLAIAFKGLPVP